MTFRLSCACLASLGIIETAQAQAPAPVPSPTAPVPAPAPPRRSEENVVIQADDAFGTSIGRETIGIYNSGSVRGFSPTQAGNSRIDGLYFDQVWGLSSRIRLSTNIRVGLSAQGYPFPAPTGVIDYAFRIPSDEASLSVSVGGNTYGSASVELDAVVPVTDRTLSLGIGAGLYHNEFYNATSAGDRVGSVTLRWTPTPSVQIVPFWSVSDLTDDEIGPFYTPAGPYLPPRVPRRRFNGPGWALYEGTAYNYGALGRWDIAPGWQMRAGFFRSLFDVHRDAYSFLSALQPDGTGNFRVVVDSPYKNASTSGELRLTRRFVEGPRSHAFHLSLRARDRVREYGGSHVVNFGPSFIGEIIDAPAPAFTFGPQTQDRVRQWTGGIAYEGRWQNVGELSFGVQRANYRKSVAQPALPITETRASPWLFNVTAAAYVIRRLALYGGYTKGLEESGVAPQTASNRNEALPAIITSQRDAGLRLILTDRLRLVAGVFDVRKPYFSLDAANLFRELGEVRNQGLEMSLSGAMTPRFSVVLGGVLSRPRVRGEDVRLGIVGNRPVGIPARSVQLNMDWRLPWLDGVSVDLGIAHLGPIPATRDNLVSLPSRTLVGLGTRYRFQLTGRSASLRFFVNNLFDEYAFELRGAGTYDFIPGRTLSAYLTVDF